MKDTTIENSLNHTNDTPFIHLRVHSQYSILKALNQVNDLAKIAKEYKMPYLALTDYNNMYGAIEFYKACLKHGIKPILGVEMDYRSNNNSKKKYKLIFLAKNNLGYKSLLHIVSVANLKDNKDPHLTFQDIKENLNQDSGLIILSSGGDGEISDILAKENFTEAKTYIEKFENILGEKSFYLEIVPQTFFNFAKNIQENTIKFAKDFLNQPERLIATQNPHYLSVNDKSAQKVLFNIHGEMEDEELYQYKFKNSDFSFINTNEAQDKFKSIQEEFGIDLIQNTYNLAETLNCEIELGK